MRGLETLLGIILILMVVLNFVNVIGRYVFNQSILGAEEVQVYALIWTAFLGTAIVTWRNMHLRMDALSNLLPRGVQSLLRIGELIVCFAVVGYTVVQSYEYVSRMKMLGAASDVAHVPMWMAHSSVLAGLVLIVLLLAAAVFTGGEKPRSGDGSSAPDGSIPQ
jgi:TRAP-type transport system small permease protein